MKDFIKYCDWKKIIGIALAIILVLWGLNIISFKQVSAMTMPSPQTVWDGRTPQGTPQPSQSSWIKPVSSETTNPSPMTVTDPSQLLPKDVNSEWNQVNPRGSGQLQNINLLSAGSLIGINTVGSSLRNPNLQLRSEPANPQTYNGPWLNSTIDPDLMRVPLEIGQGKQ